MAKRLTMMPNGKPTNLGGVTIPPLLSPLARGASVRVQFVSEHGLNLLDEALRRPPNRTGSINWNFVVMVDPGADDARHYPGGYPIGPTHQRVIWLRLLPGPPEVQYDEHTLAQGVTARPMYVVMGNGNCYRCPTMPDQVFDRGRFYYELSRFACGCVGRHPGPAPCPELSACSNRHGLPKWWSGVCGNHGFTAAVERLRNTKT